MKKILVLLLMLVMVFTFAACGGGDKEQTGEPEQGSADEPLTRVDPAESGLTDEDGNLNTEEALAGVGDADFIYSELSPAQKQDLIAQGKEDNVVVDFKADGTTTFTEEDGSVSTQNPDGTWVYQGADGSTAQLGGEWPDNEYTQQVPKPDFPLSAAGVSDNSFAGTFTDVSIEELRAYVEKVKEAGFTKSAETQDTEMGESSMYMYSAKNADGYAIDIFTVAGSNGFSISKEK